MEPEATNPYAPSESLTHEQPKVRRHLLARALAIVATVLADPLMGTGFYVFGRKRPFIAWTALPLLSTVAFVVAVRTASRWLYVMSAVGDFAAYLAVLHVAFARRGPSPPRLRRSLVVLLFLVAASYGVKPLRNLVSGGLVFENPTGGMLPELLRGDRVVLDGRGEVKRGSVLVFRSPRDRGEPAIKRVVATAGDTVEVRGGIVSVGGVPLAQTVDSRACPGVDRTASPCRLVRETNGDRSYDVILFADGSVKDFGPTTVPYRQVFVLGDNRNVSRDSRQLGAIPLENIIGIASFIVLSEDPKTGLRWSRTGRAVH